MEKFKISDIQELFASDLDRFHHLTQAHVSQLLAEQSPPVESLEEALRQAHTLKGLTATVEAWGLSCWGADLEKLLECAGTWVGSDRPRANEVFQFVLDHSQDWFVMNQFTSMELLPEAWDIYKGLRAEMEAKWPDYLPAVEAGQNSVVQARISGEDTTVLLSKSQTLPADRALNVSQPHEPGTPQRPSPLAVNPPPLLRRSELDGLEPHDPGTAQAEAGPAPASAAPPQPLSVVPPVLRKRETPAPNQPSPAPQPDAIVAAAESLQRSSADPATPPPAPTQPVPAHLTEAPLEARVQVPTPKAEVTNTPILRVAPPTLKRRVNKAPVAPVAPVVPEEMPAAVVPLSFEPVEPVPTPVPVVVEAKATEEFKPAADKDLLELLGQEVAGYLVELAVELGTLAADLSDQAAWEKVRRLFHTIKGTAATFHLDAVSAPAKAAEARCIVAIEETSARTRETFETCIQRVQALAEALCLPFDDQPLQAALERSLSSAPLVDETIAAAAVDPEMAGFFIRDASDQIETIEQAVLRWEKGETPADQVWAAQRGFHTIKGAANAIGLTAIAETVHGVEEFLEGVAANDAAGSPALFAFLLGGVDQLRHYLKELAANPAAVWRNDWNTSLHLLCQPIEGPASVTPAAEGKVEQPSTSRDSADDESHTLRIEASRLYQLMNLIGELVVDRARLGKKIEELTGLHRALAERNGALTGSVQAFQQQFEFNLLQDNGEGNPGGIPGRVTQAANRALVPGASPNGEFSEIEFDRYDQFNVLARSLIEISHDIEQLNQEVEGCLDSFAAENVRFTQTSQQLQSKVTSLSLVPINTLFPRLQRAFRDALTVEQKDADLALAGGEAQLDKVVVDKIYAPLLHLLRNAVAHGIEDATTREKLGKPARGQVRFSAAQMSNQIVIQITDDGNGVSPEAVRQRAIEKGWLAADAPELTHEQVVHYIFQPGFSTAGKVTSVSGRGIGLDVVRKEIENLNGAVEVKYEQNQGSTWILRLPLTLSISEAILADAGGVMFAFPLNFIESGLIMDEPVTRTENGSEVYKVAETSLPVVRLSKLLQLPGGEGAINGLIVSVGDRRAIVVVDRVLKRQEIVIKQLDAFTALHPLLNGATLDADGQVIPILNLPTLLKFSERAPARESLHQSRGEVTKRAGKQRVLIVDDSLSVRKVQERFLTDLGCEVESASDGIYALEKLREQEFDFIFTDLEMPRLNGYELISELHGNPAWASIPVVVISSRGADKYITKAMNLGATTFLSKPFTQQQLQQVLGHYSRSGEVTRSSFGPAPILQGAA